MNSKRIDFGEYLLKLRIKAGYSQKIVADKLGIDISMLSKIEYGERHVQRHMLMPLSELFNLNFKEIQIQYLNQKIEEEYGKEQYFNEVIIQIYKTKIKR